jgi:hypothetical protein
MCAVDEPPAATGTHADVGGIRLGVAAGLTQTAVAKRFNRCLIVNRPRFRARSRTRPLGAAVPVAACFQSRRGRLPCGQDRAAARFSTAGNAMQKATEQRRGDVKAVTFSQSASAECRPPHSPFRRMPTLRRYFLSQAANA